MKKTDVIILSILLLFYCSFLTGAETWQKYWITVSTTTPNSIIYLEDQQGRRAGADTSLPISDNGIGAEINQIPGSFTIQTSIASDEPGDPNPAPTYSTWEIGINDSEPQTFIVNLIGVKDGISNIRIHTGYPLVQHRKGIFKKVGVLIGNGTTRRIKIYFDGVQGVVNIDRVVEPESLIQDIDIACKRLWIRNEGLCTSLLAKVKAINSSIEKKNYKSARGQLDSYINEIKAQDGKGVDKKISALLIDDAKSMLQTIK